MVINPTVVNIKINRQRASFTKRRDSSMKKKDVDFYRMGRSSRFLQQSQTGIADPVADDIYKNEISHKTAYVVVSLSK